MQVESTLMNVGDGGPVSREISALSKASTSMVGNPPQTLPPEFRGDVNLSQQNKTTSTKDCKVLKACLDSSNGNNSPEISLPQQPNNAPMSSPVIASLEKGTDKRTKTSKVRSDGSGVFPAPQWSASREDSLNSCHSSVTPSKKSHPQTQSLQSLAPGLQCSAMFKPAQPVAFLPSTNFSPQLCKITLPPALGQIAALREATGNQFQKETQGSDVGGKSLMRTYPYSLSVGRTSDQKEAGSNLKLKSNHSSSKTTKSLEHKSLASVVASPSIPLPLQHPSSTAAGPTHYTLSPTAAICCGSALASITSQSRLLNHLEKANCVDKTAMGPLNAMEDHTACSNEQRDVPLDLSAKSKRPKCATDAHASTIEPHSESSQRDFLNAKRTSAYCSNTQYPVLPNSHRNGSHQKQLNRTQNHQITESKGTWGQGNLQDSIKSITGTYVGVASPILASTLRGKDGKGSFADEFQNFAKQEFISIIDQGEHLASGRKKPSCLVKGNQNAHSGKHVKNTNSALTKNCPAKGALSAALLSSAGVGSQSKCGPKSAVPHSATVVSPSWQPPLHLPHQPLQRKIPHVSSKTRDSAVTEGSKFQSPSKPEDNKWEKKKSPLSKLASIVQQQGIETAALTNEGGTQALPGAGKDVQSKHAAKFEYPPYWGVEKWPCKTESIQVTKRNETLNAAELSEYNAAGHRNKGEHVGLQAKQVCSDPSGQTPPFGSNASTNGNRIESKLAQVLEGEISKKESRTSNSTESENSEAMVASILTDQCKGRRDKPGKTANGTKDEPPTKAKVATIEQKKNSPKKPAKEKPPAEPLKKVAAKKKQDNEKTPVKVPINKKPKKQSAPASGQNLSADELSPHKKEPNRKDNISLSGAEQATRAKTDKSGPLSGDNLVSPNNSTLSNKELDTTDSSFPRLRRGQRRADDARLDLWGFATPSPPPPPMLPKDVSPSPPTTPNQPARRPRGRPRSNAPHERTLEGKGRTPGAEADTTPHRKRRRCSSKKYETGEYITEKDKLEEGDSLRQDTETPADPQRDDCASPAAPSPEPPPPPKPSYTRSGSVRYQESDDSECNSKPSGKRKFKSKHLSDGEEPRSKTRRGSSGKRGTSLPLDDDSPDAKPQITPPAPPKSLPSSPTAKKISSGRNSGSDSSPKRPVPPEVRRLIVNKNAGETLLQRAARLGYQDVVQYCLDKDSGEVNRRDNAGYTALHEASSRGWTQIVQILLKHGADVNCSAQDGTRPLHDAVASDNLPIVWLLLNHGADPTLATYSGHTPVKLAHSQSMKAFLTEYFSDLEGRCERDPSLPWDFYSSCLFETDQEACWDFLLSEENHEPEDEETKPERELDKDSLLFEFSSEPLLPCYHVQVSLTQGFCNWFLLSDVLKRLKMSSRIFRARYPHFEVVSLSQAELWRQVSVSQVSSALASPQKGKNKDNEKEDEDEEEGPVELVCCVPELQRLLGSSVHILQEEDEDEEETVTPTGKSRSR